MGELVGQIGVLPTTAGGALLLIAILVVTGVMPTPGEMRRARADLDHWRASADKWQEVATRHGITLERLLEYAETSNHVLTEIQTGLRRTESDR